MTADRATLLGLADEVERLEGPDREMDERVAFATRWRPDAKDDRLGSFAAHEERHGYATAFIAHGPWIRQWSVPAYTASRDAADSLMPKGWFVRVQGEAGACWIAEATGPTEGEYAISDVAKSEPLARTAAALRAMAGGVGDDR